MSYKPPEIAEEAKKIAKKFFQHASTVAETRNYDYAIELYLQGIAKDPQNVEQGHRMLMDVALRRKFSGGKAPGLMERMKRSTSNKKDPFQAFLNSEYLLAKDPLEPSYAEALVKNLDLAELPEALGWALGTYLGILAEQVKQGKKVSGAALLSIEAFYEKLGDYYDQNDKPDLAIQYYQAGVNALNLGIQAGIGSDYDLAGKQRDLAGKLTILKGKYERGEDFRASIKDAEGQKELQDQQSAVKSEQTLEQMIGKARQALKENPDVTGKINGLVDLLLQRGTEEDESEALGILRTAYDRTKQYGYKLRADDISIRQMARKVKQVKDRLGSGEDAGIKAELEQAQKELEEFEIAVFAERVREYPTDLKMKFEYGRRLQKAKRYDEAIPVFQEACADPRHAIRAKYNIGTCFYQKGWYQQAIDMLSEVVSKYELAGDNLSKEMHYVLGRAYESAGKKDEAMKVFSKLIQWDFNYRDVRHHIDKLQKEM